MTTVPAECPRCEAAQRRSRHWVESEDYPGDTLLPVRTLCPECQKQVSIKIYYEKSPDTGAHPNDKEPE